jgi:hypothetical protein
MNLLKSIKNKNKSFTIIELSVVILVISILIAAGIKVVSMRDIANVQSIMNRVTKAAEAIASFEEIYRGTAGNYDYTVNLKNGGLVGIDIFDGSGTGYVSAAIKTISGKSYSETTQAWVHLWAAKISDLYLTGTCNTAASCLKTNSNVPTIAELDDAVINFFSVKETFLQTAIADYAISQNKKNLLMISSNTSQDASFSIGKSAGVSAEILSKLDLKFDDGNPLTGNILASEINSSTTNKCLVTQSGVLKYNLSDTKHCMFYYLY